MTDSPHIADLEAENADLRKQLGLDRDFAAEQALRARGLQTAQARILVAMYRRHERPMTPRVYDTMPSKRYSDGATYGVYQSHLCRIRKVLGRDGIENIPQVGHRLTPVGREIVSAWLGAS